MDEKRKPDSGSSGNAPFDPFHPLYRILLGHFPESSFKVEITTEGIWFCDVTTREGMVAVDWNPKRPPTLRYGVSDIPGDGGFTHQPDIVFETAEEAGGCVVGLMWRKEFDRKEASLKEGR
jgi:hypothetical protein